MSDQQETPTLEEMIAQFAELGGVIMLTPDTLLDLIESATARALKVGMSIGTSGTEPTEEQTEAFKHHAGSPFLGEHVTQACHQDDHNVCINEYKGIGKHDDGSRFYCECDCHNSHDVQGNPLT